MKPENLEQLYIQQLRDLFNAESQLIDALPVLEAKASHPALKDAFRLHLDQTRTHRDRLDQIFKLLNKTPGGEKCLAMEGLIKEANHFIKDSSSLLGKDAPAEVVDAGLIAQAQRVEHYEISAYGTVATYAKTLGRTQDKSLLGQTLEEEKSVDQTLTSLAERLVNPAAVTP